MELVDRVSPESSPEPVAATLSRVAPLQVHQTLPPASGLVSELVSVRECEGPEVASSKRCC